MKCQIIRKPVKGSEMSNALRPAQLCYLTRLSIAECSSEIGSTKWIITRHLQHYTREQVLMRKGGVQRTVAATVAPRPCRHGKALSAARCKTVTGSAQLEHRSDSQTRSKPEMQNTSDSAKFAKHQRRFKVTVRDRNAAGRRPINTTNESRNPGRLGPASLQRTGPSFRRLFLFAFLDS